jgi:maltooligosyltrehalose synthase
VWADTRITIPQGLRTNWKDALTAQEIPDSDTIAIARAIATFPRCPPRER